MNVKLPSDIDMADRVLWGLTARQLAIVAVAVILGWAPYAAFAGSKTVGAAIGVGVAAAAGAVAFARPDGVAAERWLLSGLRHVFHPRRLVLAPEGLPELPAQALAAGRVGGVKLPVTYIRDTGEVVLERATFAIICRASALNLSLRSETEQQALVAGLGRFLNSIDAPVSFVLRAERSDLSGHVEALESAAAALPHRALEAAARAHAHFLRALAARKDILRREVYVTFTARGTDEDQAAAQLGARVESAAALLRGIGVRLTPLDGAHATGVIARACAPDVIGSPPGDALCDDIVTAVGP